jgi:hypothetical protein
LRIKTGDDAKIENLPQGLREGRSLWRDGKTQPGWYQGRHGSTKQETNLARGGIRSRKRDREEVKPLFWLPFRIFCTLTSSNMSFAPEHSEQVPLCAPLPPVRLHLLIYLHLANGELRRQPSYHGSAAHLPRIDRLLSLPRKGSFDQQVLDRKAHLMIAGSLDLEIK